MFTLNSVGDVALMVSQPGMHLLQYFEIIQSAPYGLAGALITWLPGFSIESFSLLSGPGFLTAKRGDFGNNGKRYFLRRNGPDIKPCRGFDEIEGLC